jgi:hypothetical protein
MEVTGGLFWLSVILDFSFPMICDGFHVLWIMIRAVSVNLFYILHDTRLTSTFSWTFSFNVVFCVCLFCFSFSQHDVVNITRITRLIHRSIVGKIDPTSKDVEMVKNTRSITLRFIFLSQKLELNIIYFIWFDNSMKRVIQGTCVDFCENIRSQDIYVKYIKIQSTYFVNCDIYMYREYHVIPNMSLISGHPTSINYVFQNTVRML